VEAAEPVMGKPARRLAAAAADLQGVLGDMNDAVVAEDWLRRTAQRAPASQALVAGELITTERQRQQEGRELWAQAWKRADRHKLRAWLK
jgi:CHAD domain-containing protein